MDVNNRWNSTYALVVTAFSFQNSLSDMSEQIADDENDSLDSNDWKKSKIILELFEPFNQSTLDLVKIIPHALVCILSLLNLQSICLHFPISTKILQTHVKRWRKNYLIIGNQLKIKQLFAWFLSLNSI
jgi:hypothetical protein